MNVFQPKKNSPSEFAARLKNARVTLGLTQVQVSTVANVDQGDLSRWERGERVPRTKDLVRVCEALGLTPNDLLL
jgi:transcriptional regulator with XRE-family HTH domain